MNQKTEGFKTKSKLTEIEKIVGANIRIARRIRGLTKIHLEKLIIISKHLNFDIEFFLKKFEV